MNKSTVFSPVYSHTYCTRMYRGVDPGGAGGAMAPPDFGRSVKPFSTKGTDYAHLITIGTPGFSDLPTALMYVDVQNRICKL